MYGFMGIIERVVSYSAQPEPFLYRVINLTPQKVLTSS
jgi:hypothetical protein